MAFSFFWKCSRLKLCNNFHFYLSHSIPFFLFPFLYTIVFFPAHVIPLSLFQVSNAATSDWLIHGNREGDDWPTLVTLASSVTFALAACLHSSSSSPRLSQTAWAAVLA